MRKYIGCDAHARYSIFASLREDGRWDPLLRVEYNELEMSRFLKGLPAGSPVALPPQTPEFIALAGIDC
jgi:hypothetical protein